MQLAFLFPDTYEVGMSHLGMKILYHAINRREDAWCERVFSPWVDMADLMREMTISFLANLIRERLGVQLQINPVGSSEL